MVETVSDVVATAADVTVPRRNRADAVNLYSDTDLTLDEIGRRFGVSRQTVHRWVRDAGVPLRGAMGPRPQKDEAVGELAASPSQADYIRLLVEHEDLARAVAELRGAMSAQHQEIRNQLADLLGAVERLVGSLNRHPLG